MPVCTREPCVRVYPCPAAPHRLRIVPLSVVSTERTANSSRNIVLPHEKLDLKNRFHWIKTSSRRSLRGSFRSTLAVGDGQVEIALGAKPTAPLHVLRTGAQAAPMLTPDIWSGLQDA